MKKKYLVILFTLFVGTAAYAQTDVQDGGSTGPLGGGSWLRFPTGGNTTSIVETWGLNLMGSTNQPVKVLNTSLLVGYTSGGGNVGQGNALIQGNVGIGTITPQATLDVAKLATPGDLTAVLSRLTEGNTSGIGTCLGIRAYDTQASAAVPNITNVKSFSIEHDFYGRTNSSINFLRGTYELGGSISFNTNDNSEKMRILYNGYVGIGTTTPDQMLSVKGTIHSQVVLVDMNGWNDYVFQKDYHLHTLLEVERYINENHHLPDIPSESEIIKNGLDLGKIDAIQTKKIEELTLYLIEKDKEVTELKSKADDQQREIDNLKKQMKQLLISGK